MFLAIDIGGTSLRLGASNNGRSFSTVEKYKTPPDIRDGVDLIAGVVRKMVGNKKLSAAAMAVPGPVSGQKKTIVNFTNLPGWNKGSFAALMKRALKCPILILNDAAAAGLGEARRGAGRGYPVIAYLTVSTGIGGARIVEGKVDKSSHGFEPGHQILRPDGRKCGCGQRGCFEAYASGTGFKKTYGSSTEKCRDKTVWKKYAGTLAQGIIGVLTLWSPDVLVIGGGVSRVGPRLFKPLRAAVEKRMKIFPPPPIEPAELGDQAGLYGCLEFLANQKEKMS